MKEVKPSKKPLAIYYAIVLLVLLVLNLVFVPWLTERQVKEVDYGTFMSMTAEKQIGRVDIESNQIIFTDKDEKQVYKTGLMDDPGLTQRLYDAGAQFSSEIVEQGSPVLSFLIWFALPILLFSFIGNQMNKKLMEKAGGAPHIVQQLRALGFVVLGQTGKGQAAEQLLLGPAGIQHVQKVCAVLNGYSQNTFLLSLWFITGSKTKCCCYKYNSEKTTCQQIVFAQKATASGVKMHRKMGKRKREGGHLLLTKRQKITILQIEKVLSAMVSSFRLDQ